jgi:hypothetical protein
MCEIKMLKAHLKLMELYAKNKGCRKSLEINLQLDTPYSSD